MCFHYVYCRERVHHIDDILVKGSLHIIKLKYKRHIYASIYKKVFVTVYRQYFLVLKLNFMASKFNLLQLKLMTTLHQTQPTIHALLSTSDFVGALDLISRSQELLENDLGGIHCFRWLVILNVFRQGDGVCYMLMFSGFLFTK